MIKEFNETVIIKKELALKLENILEIEQFDEDFEEKDSTLFKLAHCFEDGTRVEVFVHTGQNNAWVDSVWASKDNKRHSDSEASFDLLGEYTFSTPDCSYSLIIKAE